MIMISFENIKEHSIEYPQTWTFLYSPEEANSISQEHKDQIIFLNEEATSFLSQYFENQIQIFFFESKTYPFRAKEQFKKDMFLITANNKKELNKWLYNRGVSFDHQVFIYPDRSDHAVILTWKMVIKYAEGLFFAEDLVVFDQTSNWVLFYDHNDILSYFSIK